MKSKKIFYNMSALGYHEGWPEKSGLFDLKDARMTFFDYLKNFFFLLIILQLTPPLIEGIRREYGHYFEAKTRVGLLPIASCIDDSEAYVKELRSFFSDPTIKAIVLRMECQGGASGSSQAIYNEIQELKKEHPKPVITLVENVCASGGFWVACASDYIIAPGTALIGSIGTTFSHIFKLNKTIQKIDVGYEPLHAGSHKLATDPFVAMTEQEREGLQSILDDSYQQFTQVVASSRKLSTASVSDWADGKLFTAQQALKLGLIDELGSLSATIRAIKDRALVEGEIEWVHPETSESIWSSLFGRTKAIGSHLLGYPLLSSLVSVWNTSSAPAYLCMRC